MSNDKIKKFLFPVEEEFVPEQAIKEEPRFDSNRDLYRTSIDNTDVSSQLFQKNDPADSEIKMAKNTPKNTMVFNPTSYDDAQNIAQQVVLGNSVIVNLEHLLKDDQSKMTARRIIDFICGVSFALSIDVKKINASAFLFAKDVR